MGDRISQLPDDILTSILSFLTVRDTVRTRSLAHRWRYLSVPSSFLHFDDFTMFGCSTVNMSNFVAAVDQVLAACSGPKIGTFKVCFELGIDYASSIDKWVSFAVRMHVEKIDFDFTIIPGSGERYGFPCHILPIDRASHLKHLCLTFCTLRLSSEVTNRLSSLRTLYLDRVSLDQSDLDISLSSLSKLTQLTLRYCCLLVRLHGQLLCLKSLVIWGYDIIVELKSINLEIFEFRGRPQSLTFVDVPHLKKALVWSEDDTRTSQACNALAMGLPQLQFLSLLACYEVLPLPSNTTFNSLKQLDLKYVVRKDSDLLTVTYLLDASPLLEKLRLELDPGSELGRKRKRRDYSGPHYLHLKEVRFVLPRDRCDVVELAVYLLKNSISLERMVFEFGYFIVRDRDYILSKILKPEICNELQKQKINSAAELIFLDCQNYEAT